MLGSLKLQAAARASVARPYTQESVQKPMRCNALIASKSSFGGPVPDRLNPDLAALLKEHADQLAEYDRIQRAASEKRASMLADHKAAVAHAKANPDVPFPPDLEAIFVPTLNDQRQEVWQQVGRTCIDRR